MDYNKRNYNCNILYTSKYYTMCYLTIFFPQSVCVNHKAQMTKTLRISQSRSTSAIPKDDSDTNIMEYANNYDHVSFSWGKSLPCNVPLRCATKHEQRKFSFPWLVLSNEMRPTTPKHFNVSFLIVYYFLRLFLTDSSVSVVTMLLAGRSRNRDSIPRPALQSTRPTLLLFKQNFIEHCTLKQGFTYIPWQPQCSLVNKAISVALLYNTQTRRYNHKNSKQNPEGRGKKI